MYRHELTEKYKQKHEIDNMRGVSYQYIRAGMYWWEAPNTCTTMATTALNIQANHCATRLTLLIAFLHYHFSMNRLSTYSTVPTKPSHQSWDKWAQQRIRPVQSCCNKRLLLFYKWRSSTQAFIAKACCSSFNIRAKIEYSLNLFLSISNLPNVH